LKIEWSARALAERDAIFDFVEAESPRAAAVLDERVADQIRLLGRFPQLGRLRRVAGTRELVINETPFVAVYRIEADAVQVLRIVHCAQRWPFS
jgi:toxin ParE1/3/4